MKRVKIVSNGVGKQGTYLADAETGEKIEGLHITHINWDCPCQDVAKAVITCLLSEAELELALDQIEFRSRERVLALQAEADAAEILDRLDKKAGRYE